MIWPAPSLAGGKRLQGGVALFVALVLLLVMTVAGMSAVHTTMLEQRMALNAHDAALAFHAAEAALQRGEQFTAALTSVSGFTANGHGGLWLVSALPDPPVWERDGIWGDTTSIKADIAPLGGRATPRYLVELFDSGVQGGHDFGAAGSYGDEVPAGFRTFRITARGVGGTGTAQALVQSTVGHVVR